MSDSTFHLFNRLEDAMKYTHPNTPSHIAEVVMLYTKQRKLYTHSKWVFHAPEYETDEGTLRVFIAIYPSIHNDNDIPEWIYTHQHQIEHQIIEMMKYTKQDACGIETDIDKDTRLNIIAVRCHPRHLRHPQPSSTK